MLSTRRTRARPCPGGVRLPTVGHRAGQRRTMTARARDEQRRRRAATGHGAGTHDQAVRCDRRPPCLLRAQRAAGSRRRALARRRVPPARRPGQRHRRPCCCSSEMRMSEAHASPSGAHRSRGRLRPACPRFEVGLPGRAAARAGSGTRCRCVDEDLLTRLRVLDVSSPASGSSLSRGSTTWIATIAPSRQPRQRHLDPSGETKLDDEEHERPRRDAVCRREQDPEVRDRPRGLGLRPARPSRHPASPTTRSAPPARAWLSTVREGVRASRWSRQRRSRCGSTW